MATTNSNDLLTSNQQTDQPPHATGDQQAQVDLRALAEKVLALFKEELRLERERLARHSRRGL